MRLLAVLLAAFVGLVSPCLNGGFHCTSGKCVPQEEICDFKSDCNDGSDEEFCGYVMYAERFMNMAILEYFVNTSAALGCQMSFWYHMQQLKRSSFYVKMQRENTITELISISKSKTNGWENATAFIGNQPGGYRLLFSFEYSIFEAKDMMLDDISFKYCSEEEIPEGSSQLTCNFEEDTCSWYHDYNTSLLWKRSKGNYGDDSPGFDHTSGNGYYMFIAAKSNLDPSSTARLISYPQPKGQVICVSFWYHIFGNSIGSLRFIKKHAGEQDTVVWMRNGTLGNRWRFADLTFTSDTAIQFILEAVVGGTQGSISIDDIEVFTSHSGSCPAERECTFQGSLCGLQPHLSADLSWSRVNGAQLNNSFGPATDHTLGTKLGYYLSAQLWHHPVGTRVGMVTAVMETTPPSGECWMFWYYMEGKDVGELNVYLQTPGGSRELLWTRIVDQGKHWRHGRVTVMSPLNPYQVIFEGVVGDESNTDIAMDDLTVMNGACPPAGFCDFEMDYCGWVNNPLAGSGIDWDWLSGISQGSLNPAVDHTTNSKLGHYVYFLSSKSNGKETAHLESELMTAVGSACLEFWYNFQGWHIYELELELTVFVNDTTGLHSVWNLNGTSSREWHRARVDYNATGPHQIVLQANRPDSETGSIALDDIHIMREQACVDINPTTSPNHTTTPNITLPSSPMDCTFEEGLCNWNQDTRDVLNWTRITGLEADQPWNGPLYDHTFANDQGFYLLFNGSGYKDGEIAVISTPVSLKISPVCVEFWYYMLGPSVPSLELLFQRNSSMSLAWSRRGSQDLKWINAQVTIDVNDAVSIMFIGRRNSSSRGFVAIDDIKVQEGGCISQIVCGFDFDWCGFESDVSHLSHWVRTRGDGLDHTYGTTHGFYLTVLVHNPDVPEVAQLLTPELTVKAAMCIRFWYWWAGGSRDIFSVHILRGNEQNRALWQCSGAPSTDWEVAELTVTSPYKFRVVFKVTHYPGTNSAVSVGLDDVSIRVGACTPTGSCDFESGQCTWVNVFKTHGHDWVQADGHFQGLPTDHTTQTPEGHFLLSLSKHQNKSSVAQVVSEWIQPQTISCFSFWYHMDGSDSGTLRVYIRSGPTEEQIVLQTNTGGPSWNLFSDSMNSTKPFQVLIEAESINIGYIAIDDIALTPGLCSVNGTFRRFMGCSFENNTCDWEDVSIGQLKWLRDRNAPGGPTVDHTLGTELGWYMLPEAGRGHEEGSLSVLQSPTMIQASAACTLHFYYHMYGQGTLKVMLGEGSTDTVLWWLEGDMGDSWHCGKVLLGRTPQEFTVLFEASWTSRQLGDIAIDDIDFSSCTLPEPQPLCPLSMFACNNSVCVEPNRVCDLTDDCGDESDETNCELLGVVDRCSFEQGLCSWAGSELRSLAAQWIRLNGIDAWPEFGPPRDHTQNTAAGHYIVPHLTEQTSEILSNTLLPSTNCTVRFYYYSLRDAAARLAVHSRREQAGNEDTLLWLRNQSHSYSWQRAEVTFSCSANSKIVFRYEWEGGPRGLVALDDISFSMNCKLDPNNSQLPLRSTTSLPPTSSDAPITTAMPTTSIPPTNPCKEGEFFCWESEGIKCIPSSSQCDYSLDCPLGEDESVCGPCTFESGQCQWVDTSNGYWQRQRASNSTVPPTDHTTVRGHYMTVNFSGMQGEARLQSPTLPPPSEYCQILFHFHISGEGAGSLRLLMKQDKGSEEILWSQNHNRMSQWTPVYLPLGRLYARPYKVVFSSKQRAGQGVTTAINHPVAVDDISFLNCERSYHPPGVFHYDCSFEDGLCGWIQVAEDDLDFQRRSSPTQTANTGPAGDHTTGTGQYLYIESSLPSVRGTVAQLMSPMLPSGGENGYCITFWYHMFGATVGSLKMVLQTTYPIKKRVVWQQQGSRWNEWREVRAHVTLREVHRVVLEATVGGEAGVIAIDDVKLFYGPCGTPGADASHDNVVIALAIGLSLMGAAVFSMVWVLMRGRSTTSEPGTMDNNFIDLDIFNLYDFEIDGTHYARDSDNSFSNPNFLSPEGMDSMTSSDV